MIRIRIFLLVVPLLYILFSAAAVAQTPPNAVAVTVPSGQPTPNPAMTGKDIDVTYNLSVSAPTAITDELRDHGATQEYVVQLSDDTAGNQGRVRSVTLLGITVNTDDTVGDFSIVFDNANSRVTVSTIRTTAMLPALEIHGQFSAAGHKHMNLDGHITVDGTRIDTDSGGHAAVLVIDFHLRADTNHSGGAPTADDDLSSAAPGLFVPYRVPGQAADPKNLYMVLDPITAVGTTGTSYPRYVQITRDNTNVKVWKGNALTTAVLVNDTQNTWDLRVQGSHDSFVAAMNDLWAEGVTAGDTDLHLKLIDNHNNDVIFDTKLVCHVWGIEIQVNNTDDPARSFVWRKSDAPANRPQINCRARVIGNVAGTDLYLENGGGAGTGQLRFGTGANAATNNNVTITLAVGAGGAPGAWTAFTVSGETDSAASGDAIIQGRLTNATGGIAAQGPMTVLWVSDPHIDITAPGTYALNTTTGNWTTTNGRPGVELNAYATIKPADFGPMLTEANSTVRVGIVQNQLNGSTLSINYTATSIAWNVGVVAPTQVTMRTVYSRVATYTAGDLLDSTYAGPLYDGPGVADFLKPPLQAQGGAVSHSRDTPQISGAGRTTVQSGLDGGGVARGNVTYSLNSVVENRHFRTWCVLYDTSDSQVKAFLRQRDWDLTLSSTGAAPLRISVAGADAPPTNATITGVTANDAVTLGAAAPSGAANVRFTAPAVGPVPVP